MSAWTTRTGSMPSRDSHSARRGLADARIRAGGGTPRPLLRPRADPAGHEAESNECLGQIVRRELAQHLVADQHADAVLSHPSRSMAEHFMTILELHSEHRVGQQFHYLAAHLEEFFFGHAVSVSFRRVGRP